MMQCMNCAEILIEHVPVPDLLVKPAGKCKLGDMEEEESRPFFRCPACRAKNFVAETRNPHGFPELRIVDCLLE